MGCRYWPTPGTVTTGPQVAISGGRVVLAGEAGVFGNLSTRLIAERDETTGFAVVRGDGWFAVAIRGEPGEPDYLLYRPGEQDWQAVFAPANLLGRRWTDIVGGEDEVWVRAESGVVASFDGETWQERTSIASNRGDLVVGGSQVFTWLEDVDELHVWDGNDWQHMVEAEGPAVVGDPDHIYIPTHVTSRGTWEFSLLTEDGLEPLALPPDVVTKAVARGSELAIQTASYDVYVYAGNAYGWSPVTRGELHDIDSDRSVLVVQGGGLEVHLPNGARNDLQIPRPNPTGAVPTGPLVGDSLESLWSLSTSGALLQLDGQEWISIPGSAELSLVALWASPSGDLFAASQSRVYELVDDALTPVGNDELPGIHSLTGLSSGELYVAAANPGGSNGSEFYVWRGKEWEHLEHLSLATTEEQNWLDRYPGPILALGSGKLVTEYDVLDSFSEDALDGRLACVSGDSGWEVLRSSNDGYVGAFNLRHFGTAESPKALLLTNYYWGWGEPDEHRYQYELIDEDGAIAETGSFDEYFDLNFAGTDFNHMVGVSDAKLLIRDGSPEWHELTALSEVPLRVSSNYLWMGRDAVGYASGAGTTICPYDW